MPEAPVDRTNKIRIYPARKRRLSKRISVPWWRLIGWLSRHATYIQCLLKRLCNRFSTTPGYRCPLASGFVIGIFHTGLLRIISEIIDRMIKNQRIWHWSCPNAGGRKRGTAASRELFRAGRRWHIPDNGGAGHRKNLFPTALGAGRYAFPQITRSFMTPWSAASMTVTDAGWIMDAWRSCAARSGNCR